MWNQSSTNQKRINQVIGRVVRYKSHINMPKAVQYVNVWRYWSIAKNHSCVDEVLYNEGLGKINTIDDFQQRLIDNSIT